MKGFDDRFANMSDYILGVTQGIWKDRAVGAAVKEFYHPEVIIRTPGGISFGGAAKTKSTMSTLVEFPDLICVGEDEMWSGSPDVGMLASYRTLSMATHLRDGRFGTASGKRVIYRSLCESYAKTNKISDEWLIRDTGAIARQLGYDIKEWIRDQIANSHSEAQPFRPEIDVQGPYSGRGNDNQWGAAFGDLLVRIMSGDYSAIRSQYDPAIQNECPGGITGHGTAEVEAFWLGLRGAFPSAEFAIHHQIGLEDPNMPPRAAIRWSLTGKHDGWGAFGRPTGADVHVMGISQAEFGPRGLRREWTLFDETAIWSQIVTHQG